MKKLQFVKSVTTGVIGLTLLSGCSGAMEKMGTNKCAGKKTEASHSCSSKHACSSKKVKKSSNTCSSNGCSAQKAKKSSHSCSANGCKSAK